MIHPEDYNKAMKAMKDHLEGKTPNYEVPYRIRKKDGSYALFLDKGGVVNRNETGKPLRITGIVIDVTDQ